MAATVLSRWDGTCPARVTTAGSHSHSPSSLGSPPAVVPGPHPPVRDTVGSLALLKG